MLPQRSTLETALTFSERPEATPETNDGEASGLDSTARDGNDPSNNDGRRSSKRLEILIHTQYLARRRAERLEFGNEMVTERPEFAREATHAGAGNVRGGRD